MSAANLNINIKNRIIQLDIKSNNKNIIVIHLQSLIISDMLAKLQKIVIKKNNQHIIKARDNYSINPRKVNILFNLNNKEVIKP